MHRVIYLAAALLLKVLPVDAAEVFRAEPITDTFVHAFDDPAFGDATPEGSPVDFSSSPHFRVEGTIVPGDAAKLEKILREELPDPNVDWSNNVIISLNSDGGDFYEGIALADVISAFAVPTFVGPGDRCLSSCAIAFLGGHIIYIRRSRGEPLRYVHDEAIVGFHAPFSELPSAIQLPEGTPLTEPLIAQITRQFYGQAQAAINEITKRMSDWRLSSDFVFSMLTKESIEDDNRPIGERFMLINSYEAARETGATVLTSRVVYPQMIGYLDARGACDYLMQRATGDWYSFLIGPYGHNFQTPEVITETTTQPYFEGGKMKFGSPRTNGQRFPSLEKFNGRTRLVPGADPEAFYFTTPNTQGIGVSQCSVFRFDDGRWYAKAFNENVYYPDNKGKYRGNQILDFETPVPVSLHTTLGPRGAWIGLLPMHFIEADDLVGMYPDEIRNIEEASFDCNGTLDPAAAIICEAPALAKADGQMVALFKWARKKDPEGVLSAQRHWVKARDRACRPDKIDRSVPELRRSLAECILMFTQARSRSLVLGN